MNAIEAHEKGDREAVHAAWDDIKRKYPVINGGARLGDSVNPGWWHLLESYFTVCQQQAAVDPTCRVELQQIKEKFGGLRIYSYIEGSDESIIAIEAAENIAIEAAWKTCEACGQPGELRGGGWLRTLCEAHAVGR